MFLFYFLSYRKGILTFSGSEDFEVVYDPNGYDCKECFRRFDNGQYTIKHENGSKSLMPIPTRHPNILYSVIKGKKSWGLQVKEWSFGISDCDFTKEEILNEFYQYGIEVPESMITELDNNIKRNKMLKHEKEYKRLMKLKRGYGIDG